MLKFIQNLFGIGKAEAPQAPFKVEAPAGTDTPKVNETFPVVNGRKKPAKKPAQPKATGNAPAKIKATPKKAKKPAQSK
jgi:hypothetical protein